LIGLSLSAAGAPRTGTAQPGLETRIDSLFLRLGGPSLPGCVVAAAQGEATVLSRAYGRASLELEAPLTTASVLNAGSIAKQFTAYMVMQLVREGRLSLDHDVREVIPELPEYETPIRIRHLLYHTSGLHDVSELLRLGGIDPWIDVVSDVHTLRLIASQRSTGFPAGERYGYSDTNYELLARVLERVSGRPLEELAYDRVFAPLGMDRTRFPTGYDDVIPGRVPAYVAKPGGFRTASPNAESGGAGSLFTTAEDLLRWARHLEFGADGPGSPTSPLLRRETLSNGDTLAHGMGLETGQVAGQRTVGFSGAHAGYVSALEMAPDPGIAVAVLCNVRTSAPGLARRVMELMLPHAPPPAPPAPRRNSAVMDEAAAAGLATFTGFFWSPSAGATLSVRLSGRELVLVTDTGDSTSLRPLGNLRFQSTRGATVYTFLPANGTLPVRISRSAAAGPDDVYERRREAVHDAAKLAAYAGLYRSDDLGVTWEVVWNDGRLVLRRPRTADEPMTPLFDDGFDHPRWYLVFSRDASGRITGVSASNMRLAPIAFQRVPG
ncbi:MAG TPA: serine hydrolase domain-containing protein, partial [Longimicrobium sp.]|nr:serine hydrolase domain-containing protein [Longimicrobium sp.]